MSLHIKFHLAMLRFIAKDPLGFSESVSDEGLLEEYFLQLFGTFQNAHHLLHLSDTGYLIGLTREMIVEIVRVLYLQQESQSSSIVIYVLLDCQDIEKLTVQIKTKHLSPDS